LLAGGGAVGVIAGGLFLAFFASRSSSCGNSLIRRERSLPMRLNVAQTHIAQKIKRIQSMTLHASDQMPGAD